MLLRLMPAYPRIPPPSKRLLLLEGRALWELARWRRRLKTLDALPRGDGHAVLVLPGYGAGDAATRPLREVLRRLNYVIYGWGPGRNFGTSAAVRDRLRSQVEQLHAQHGPLSLIGWSVGGVFARELARHAPQRIRRVFTLGSPFNVCPDANNLLPVMRLINLGRPVRFDYEGFQRRRSSPPVPCVAIHSKTDGIIAWPCSVEEAAPNTENVEVQGSHFGLMANPEVWRVIAERLARP